MIREQPEDFLTILKSYVPDRKQPVPAIRRDFSEFYETFQSGDRPAVKVAEIHSGLTGYWCSVPESRPDYILLFFHGGNFMVGSTKDHLGFIAQLARATKTRVFSAEYRLFPEHPWPAAPQDALLAYQYLTHQGISSHRIIPVGISAGGTLVLNLLHALREQHLVMPAAAVSLSPFTDFRFPGKSVISNRDRDWLDEQTLKEIAARYVAGNNPADPALSPATAQLSGYPPLYLQAGTHEILFDDISAFVKKVKWAGGVVRYEVWEGMFHSWQVFDEQVPEAQAAVSRIGAFAQEMFSR